MYKFTVSLPKLTLQQGLSLGAKTHLPQPPNRNLSGDSLPSKCDLEVKYAHQNLYFLHGLVGRTLVWQPLDLPDLILQPWG